VIILDYQVELKPFFLLKQYLTTGKLRVTNTKITSETKSQLEDIMAWICPGVQLSVSDMSRKSIKMTPAGAPCKISSIESLESPDYAAADGFATMKAETLNGKLNNNQDQEDLKPSWSKGPKLKHLMKCHVCGLTKRYLAQHEWLFKKHVKNCHGKVDLEETVIDLEEENDKDQVVTKDCVLCTKTFRNLSTLKNHLTIAHFRKEIKERFVVPTGEEQNKVKRCVECSHVTRNMASLVMHYGSVHNKLYEVATKEVMDSLPSEKRKRKSHNMSKCPSTGSVKMDESDNSDSFKEEAEFNGED